MTKRLKLALSLCILLLSILPVVHAQPSLLWSAWLHESGTRRLYHVTDNGTVLNELTLPIPELPYNLINGVGVSHSGNLIIYFAQHETTLEHRFLMYDVPSRTMFSGVYNPPAVSSDGYPQHSLNYRSGSQMFSADDTRLALSFNPGNIWELQVIDVNTRRITHTLRSTDAIVGAVGLPAETLIGIPIVQEVTGDEVWFTYMETLEGAPRLPSYVWNTATNTLTRTERYPQPFNHRLVNTGELLVAYQDESYPNRLDALIGYPIQFNVVRGYAPSIGDFLFYNNPEESVNVALIAENGRRIFMETYNILENIVYWRLMERDGTALDLQVPLWDAGYHTPTRNGFAFIAYNAVEGRGVLFEQNTTTGDLSSAASVWIAPEGVYPALVSMHDPDYARGISFMDWGYASGATLGTPPVLPATPADSRPLGVGDVVRIFTTEGDALNMRSAPGTGFSVVTRLPANTSVTLIEGPVDADGFRWWRVRTASGVEGWVVEAADGINTLIR